MTGIRVIICPFVVRHFRYDWLNRTIKWRFRPPYVYNKFNKLVCVFPVCYFFLHLRVLLHQKSVFQLYLNYDLIIRTTDRSIAYVLAIGSAIQFDVIVFVLTAKRAWTVLKSASPLQFTSPLYTILFRDGESIIDVVRNIGTNEFL